MIDTYDIELVNTDGSIVHRIKDTNLPSIEIGDTVYIKDECKYYKILDKIHIITTEGVYNELNYIVVRI